MPVESWQELIDGAMARNEDRAARRSMAVNYPNPLYALVLEGSRTRNLSMTAYQRRAALAFAEWDIGFDWCEAMVDEPPIGRYFNPQARNDAQGRGYGPWHILDLAEHAAVTEQDADGD